jgi:hypothetical protein
MSAAEIDIFESPGSLATLARRERFQGVVIGTLLGFKDDGRMPLVLYPGQPGTAAIEAAAILDLHANHIGCAVVLQFESGDLRRPIILGLLRPAEGWPLDDKPAQVEVDVDGQRLVVTAKEQLVFKCGKASITLTKAGKVIIKGAHVSTVSSGVNRIQGGSIQLN